jgi:hypothetical protein
MIRNYCRSACALSAAILISALLVEAAVGQPMLLLANVQAFA